MDFLTVLYCPHYDQIGCRREEAFHRFLAGHVLRAACGEAYCGGLDLTMIRDTWMMDLYSRLSLHFNAQAIIEDIRMD